MKGNECIHCFASGNYGWEKHSEFRYCRRNVVKITEEN